MTHYKVTLCLCGNNVSCTHIQDIPMKHWFHSIQISISKSLEVTHWLGKPQEKKSKRNVTFSVDGNQEKTIKEAAVYGAHHCAPMCLFISLVCNELWSPQSGPWENKTKKTQTPLCKTSFCQKILWVTFYSVFSEAFTRSSPEGRVIPLCQLSNFCSQSYQL